MLCSEYVLIKDLAADILEGGAGSGHYGHKGRPGKKGGSLPGGGVSAFISGSGQRRITSTQMGRYLTTRIQRGRYTDVRAAANRLRQRFPGQSDDRYGRSLRKAGFTKEQVLTAVSVTPGQALTIARARPRNAQGLGPRPNLQTRDAWNSLSHSIRRIASANGMASNVSLSKYSNDKAAGFDITFTREGRSAGHLDFSLDARSKAGYISGFFMSRADQGTGLGMNAIDSIVRHAEKVGVESVSLYANGTEGIGRYAWAVMGFDFVPSRRETESIRFKSWLRGKNIDYGDKGFMHSWDIASFEFNGNKVGKDFLINHHESYQGTFDVRPGSKSRRALENYMSERNLRGDKKDKAA